MRYTNITRARFLARPNRFIAEVEADGCALRVHVKNTGRCAELLEKDNCVYLTKSDKTERKTQYDLVAVEKRNGRLINMDSQAVNEAAYEWLRDTFPRSRVEREVTYAESRLDFCLTDEDGGRTFFEVKGVTLEKDGVVRFPDAPTLRGVKHLHTLMKCVDEGFRANVLFVVQMKDVRLFRPNDETHPQFGEALRRAKAHGVGVLAYDCIVTPETMVLNAPVKVDL